MSSTTPARSGSSGPRSFDRVFVGGVPRGTTEPQLRAALALAGVDVGSIEFSLDRVTGLQRGFAFVMLRTRLDVGLDPSVLDLLRSATIEGCALDVQGVPERLPHSS